MSLVSNTRGSVFVETLIAVVVPVLFFFVAWQLVDLFTAQLVLKHAAVAAARAAIVVGPDERRFYGGQGENEIGKGDRHTDIEAAAALVLAAAPNLVTFGVELKGTPSGNNPITAAVSADYACHGGWLSLVCGGGGSRRLTAEATLPYQGAQYKYVGE
jgi:hypothetical protein